MNTTTIIIVIAIALVIMIAGMIMLSLQIRKNSELMQQLYYNLVSDIADAMNEMTTFKNDLDYAISRLPKSRSKKVDITMATNDTIEDALKEE